MANSAFSVTGSASGTGTVTSVAASSTDLTITGSPITTSGTLGFTLNTVTVPKGGTGLTSATAYAVLTGGTTSTGAFQSIASVGTSGQVLTSNGAGALPSFQSVSGTGTVTSIIAGTGLSGGTITTSGTIAAIMNSFVQGRLTLTSGTPVTTADVTAATALYFTPYKGYYLSLFTSGVWKLYTFTQLSIAVPNTTSQMYDVFVYDNTGTLTLELVAWTNDTTRSVNLVVQDGVYCKNGSVDRRYLGSFRTTGVSGQTQDAITGRYLYNYYNRTNRNMRAISATANWNYSSTTWRQANNDPSNQLNFVCGVIEDAIDVTVLGAAAASGTVGGGVGVGVNSTSINSATIWGSNFFGTIYLNAPARYDGTGYGVGYNYMAWLEATDGGASVTWVGTAISIGPFTSEFGISGNLLM